ncbi:MAG: hypothetical protein M3P92_12555, partial [Actinomycetota bacterium]|nr:hypothetical protein [Actinomycetota bacterium]
VTVPLRLGTDLRAQARLPHNIGRTEAVVLGQRKKPIQAGGVQEVAARKEQRGRGALGSERDDVGIAEAVPTVRPS